MFSWYKYLIVSLVFSHLGFRSGSLFLIAPFPDLCLLVLFPYYLPLNVLLLPKDQIFGVQYILFAITAAGVVPCGGPKKSPRTSSIVQIIFSFRSFEISKDIQSVQNTHV